MEKLIAGFKAFRVGELQEKAVAWEELFEKGQSPRVAVVACSDSRVDPATVLNTGPGEIFVIRNVANLVPPFDETAAHYSVSAALEYAVQHLNVEHILVLGHAYCGGIGSLFQPGEVGAEGNVFIPSWMTAAEPAHRRVVATLPDASETEQARACEMAAIQVSLENLMTFDFVRERVSRGALKLHGWHVDIRAGTLSCYKSDTNQFETVD